MPGIIVVGLQWGDEGKGKVVDLLSVHSSHIVRSMGGSNAGHTIKVGDRECGLHLIPSGIFQPHAHCYIAGGCLVDPKSLIEEIDQIEKMGIVLGPRLHLSLSAHLILPFHRTLDRLYEEKKKGKAIGTTGRGIGPCMSDRANRIGLRIADLLSPERLKDKLETLASIKNLELENIFGQSPINVEEITRDYIAYGEKLAPFVVDVEGRINRALTRDETVLFEGAHGTLLDGIYGSYPFVTSSSTLTGGVCAGAGVGPTRINEAIGVLKAYTTRVGGGPLPTTVNDDELSQFQSVAEFRELGTTTGRQRRIGWLDLVLARYAVELNGVSSISLTKLDILDDFDEISVCTGYHLNGKKLDRPPSLAEDLERVEPIYEKMPGWKTSTRGARKLRALPKRAQEFIEKVEDFCRIPVSMVSVGPDREETIHIDQEWAR